MGDGPHPRDHTGVVPRPGLSDIMSVIGDIANACWTVADRRWPQANLPYFLCIACLETPSIVPISAQENPWMRARRTATASAAASSCLARAMRMSSSSGLSSDGSSASTAVLIRQLSLTQARLSTDVDAGLLLGEVQQPLGAAGVDECEAPRAATTVQREDQSS